MAQYLVAIYLPDGYDGFPRRRSDGSRTGRSHILSVSSSPIIAASPS